MTPSDESGRLGERIEEIAGAIRAGEVAAIPTDTVYGLAALPDDEAALRRLAALKGRPEAQPFAVLFDNIEAIRAAVEEPDALDALDPFWPGPLTAVVRVASSSAHAFVEPAVTPQGTIGLRMPDDAIALAVIRACGGALAVTSANRSGEPPAEEASEATAMFGEELPVLDGGPRRRPPSTVIDLTAHPPAVLREGPIESATVLAALEG